MKRTFVLSVLSKRICALSLLALSTSMNAQGLYSDMGLKPRIIVLTDIAPGNVEPDDMESMIRLMAHADLYEMEALIASGGWNSSGRAFTDEQPMGASFGTASIVYLKSRI